jgi:hypothetical protein
MAEKPKTEPNRFSCVRCGGRFDKGEGMPWKPKTHYLRPHWICIDCVAGLWMLLQERRLPKEDTHDTETVRAGNRGDRIGR